MSEQPAPNPELDLTFDELFDEYATFVWRVLGRLGVASSDLADTSQEVFLVVHRRLGDFEGRSSVKSWIYGICVRVAAAWRRKPHRVRERLLDEDVHETSSGSQDEELEQRRAREKLVSVLERLDEDKRNVFVLYELEELTMPQVAEALGCPLTTAYSRLHAARKTVRAAFARESLANWRAE
ncbi:MAG: sigma-70 family RNA polymerase sigma factor [Polyangiaceae bacterium]